MKNMVKKGFTLIELLIVIAIIGILAVAFLPSLLDAPAKARDTQRIANVQAIQNALTNEFLGGGAYPTGDACIDTANDTGTAGEIQWTDIVPTLGGVIPTDPQSLPVGGCAGEYFYVDGPGGVGSAYSYGLYTKLENATGNIACTAATGAITEAQEAVIVDGTGDCYGILVQ